jgi:hypothetical protein
MKTFKKWLPLLVGIPFTLWSGLVILEHGYFGFLRLAAREPWAMQMLLDLTISLCLVGTWIRRDARAAGISPVPYLVLLPLLGSPVALAYLVHRALVFEREWDKPALPGMAASQRRERAVPAVR